MKTRPALLALLAAPLAALAADGPEPAFDELDPRELHNLGTRRLAAGDLAGSEEALRAALGRNRDALRPGSLHNLGHVRFGKGRASLGGRTEGDITELSLARSYIEAADADISDMTDMIEYLDRMKAEGKKPDYVPAVAALSSGIGTHRTMRKQSIPAAEQALAKRAGVAAAWLRSVGDFRGAHELDAADAEARANADKVEELLRLLRRENEQLRGIIAEMARKHKELREVILELMKRIPPEERPANGEGEEDDEFGEPREPRAGSGPGEAKPGEEGKMSEQEARSQLESLQDQFGRRMPAAGQGQPGRGRPSDRKGKDY
ncbi:MAG: hypothetical protein ACK5VI_08085 [Opitutia bacterium]|jgi:hypothetical protein